MTVDGIRRDSGDDWNSLRFAIGAQLAPKEGTLTAARARFAADPALVRGLERRRALLYEVPLLWPSRPVGPPVTAGEAATSAAFTGMRTRTRGAPARFGGTLPIDRRMTFRRFARDYLPHIAKLWVTLPSWSGITFITTAVHQEAARMFTWDHHLAWYMYVAGTRPEDIGLVGGWLPVAGVGPLVSASKEWQGEEWRGAIFYLEGAYDKRDGHGGLFPENVRGDLHEFRAVIEEHGRVHGLERGSATQPTAIGLDLRRDAAPFRPVSLCCTTSGLSETRSVEIIAWD
jgi:hypothetical protein